MKTNTLRLGLTAILAFVISIAYSHDFQGQAYYQTKSTIDMDNFGGGREIAPDQKKRIEERMKSFLDKTYQKDWDKITISENLNGLDAIENYAEFIFKQKDFNTNKAFPFRIETTLPYLDYHIIFKKTIFPII